jgi:hypothetical protein
MRASVLSIGLACIAASVMWVSLSAGHVSAQRAECLSAHTDAQLLRKQGALLQAREKLLDCSQSACPRLVVNDCMGWLSEVENSLSSVVFALSDAHGRDISDARVSGNEHLIAERTDGRAVLLDPGTYNFAFEAPGYVIATQVVSLRQSEKNRIVRVQLTPVAKAEAAPVAAELAPHDRTPAPPEALAQAASAHGPSYSHGHTTALVAIAGTGLVGAGTFVVFGLLGNDKLQRVEQCEANCSSDSRVGRRDYVIADIGLAVAVATVPILVYLALSSSNDDTGVSQQRVQLRALGAQRGVSVEWSGRF